MNQYTNSNAGIIYKIIYKNKENRRMKKVFTALAEREARKT